MKKRETKLDFHRDTLRHLDAEELNLPKIAGAGPHTSESRPCCGGEIFPSRNPIRV